MTVSRLFMLRVLLISMIIAASHTAYAAVPRTWVDTTTKSFGQVAQGDVIKQRFTMKNVGDAPLLIHNVQFSMPGMSIRVKQEIGPNEAVEAEISWDSIGFVHDVTGQALLFLNDPQIPRLLLTMTGHVQAPIEVLPVPALYLSQFRGEEKVGRLTVKNNQSKALNITKVDNKGGHFKVSLETQRPGKVFDLKVTVPATTPLGRYRESLVLHTDNPERPRIGVEVNILVKPDVYVIPETAEFGVLSLSETRRNPSTAELIKQTFIIKRRDGTMEITRVETDIPFLKVEMPSSGAEQGFKIDAGVDFEHAVPGPFNGTIILITDDSNHPRVEIPVTGLIQP